MRTRWNAVAIIGTAFVIWLAVGGCQQEGRDNIISAVGSYGEIAVMMTDPELEPALESFREKLSPVETFVIKQEDTYRFHYFMDKRWKDGRNYRNLLFVVRWGAGDPVEKAVRRLLSKEAVQRLSSGRGGVVTVHDPYFRNQLAIIAAATDANDLVRSLNRQADTLGDTLFRDINRRIVGDNRRLGLLPDVARRAWNSYGFGLEVPAVFKENQSRPDGYPGVEWMRTDGATRGITVAWDEVPDPEAVLADRDALKGLRDALGVAMHDEQIDGTALTWSTETVAGLPAVKLSGNWTSSSVGVGGVFWCYFVADVESGRVYCLDLLVYAPNKEKMDYFRRLRAVLETFSLAAPAS